MGANIVVPVSVGLLLALSIGVVLYAWLFGAEDGDPAQDDVAVSEFDRGYAAASAGVVVLMAFAFIMGLIVASSMYVNVSRVCLSDNLCL